MTLPEITLPKVELPFDIPVLLHPLTDHFIIAIPVVILLLEIMNLIMKKKAVSGVTFFLILLTIVAAIGAYFTGLVDGKEAYPTLGEAAKTALSDHKLLGTYVMLASGVVLFFKLISMLSGSKIIKSLYLLVLIAFVLALFKQGKEGGELVYKHGMNVEQVKILDDELFDLKEELEDATAEIETAVKATKKVVVQKEAVKQEVIETIITAPVTEEVVQTETITSEPVVEKTPEDTTPMETIGDTLEESIKTEVKPETTSSVMEPVKVLEVEGMPEEVLPPTIATH